MFRGAIIRDTKVVGLQRFLTANIWPAISWSPSRQEITEDLREAPICLRGLIRNGTLYGLKSRAFASSSLAADTNSSKCILLHRSAPGECIWLLTRPRQVRVLWMEQNTLSLTDRQVRREVVLNNATLFEGKISPINNGLVRIVGNGRPCRLKICSSWGFESAQGYQYNKLSFVYWLGRLPFKQEERDRYS